MKPNPHPFAYFEQAGESSFLPTEHAGGAWKDDELHIAPVFGLVTHRIEEDRDRRRADGLQLTRLSFDILGTLDLAPFDVTVSVIRPGRTIELVEARVTQGNRTGVIARAWLTSQYDTSELAGSALEEIPGPGALEPWDPTSLWPGGMIRSIKVRRELYGPGSGATWLSTEVPILADREISPLASMLGIVDVANGMAVRVSPSDVAFPNLDLTAHLFREPVRGWTGLRTRASFGSVGAGLTHSVLYDEVGPVGTIAQTLTVRPRS